MALTQMAARLIAIPPQQEVMPMVMDMMRVNLTLRARIYASTSTAKARKVARASICGLPDMAQLTKDWVSPL